MNRHRTRKIALIILLASITFPLLLFYQTLDDFVPKHIAMIMDVCANGKLIEGENDIIQIPGFYLLGAIITIISGLSPEKLVSFPIQVIPYAAILFCLIYRISDNSIVAGIITFIDLSSGVNGTAKLFFWPHGIGYILFFLITILVIDFIRNEFDKRVFLLIIVTGASLVFLSYNLAAWVFLLLAAISIISAQLYIINKFLKLDNVKFYFDLTKKALTASVAILFVEMGLSRFVYGVFIPTLQSSQDLEISALEKFSIAYTNPDLSGVVLSPIMVHYPISITIISAIKYGLLALVILGFCLFVGKKFYTDFKIDKINLVLISVIVMQGLYAIPRLLIGGIVVTALWLPGIFSLARLPRISEHLRIWSVLVILALLALTFVNYGIYSYEGSIDRVYYETDGYMESNNWFNEKTNAALFVSDELTKNFKILYDSKMAAQSNNLNTNYNEVAMNSRRMSPDEAGVLAKLQDGALNDNSYYVLNNRLSRMSLENWIVIQSWQKSDNVVTANPNVYKIYDNSLLSVYRPS
ncbi:MAG: hypothetical protein ABFC38_14810 [Methanospirillum sp.]